MSLALELPLSPAVFFTLFALAGSQEPGGEKHGYAIMQDVRKLSDGSFRMGPATLYTTLQRLLELELIEETIGETDGDRRRRTYRLTSSGRALLAAELDRVEALLRKAKAIHRRLAEAKS